MDFFKISKLTVDISLGVRYKVYINNIERGNAMSFLNKLEVLGDISEFCGM